MKLDDTTSLQSHLKSSLLQVVARRLLWGKLINLGQTCVAPDYVLCSPAVDKRLVSELSVALTEWYGANPQQSPDLCRIINERHFDRLSNLIKTTTGEVVIGEGGVTKGQEQK